MEEKLEIELTEDTVLKLPNDLFYHKINNSLLVISQNKANWIGLFNKEQERIFTLLLERKPLGEVLKLADENDFNFVISQIIDRKFLVSEEISFNEHHSEGLYIYLTNDCNLACTHCYMFSGKPKIDELPKEEWFKIIKNAKENGIKSITFTGGEVLRYKDWFEIIKFTKENDITVTILTNGVLWDEEKIDKSKNYIDEIQISLDGTDEISNSVIRGKNNFEKALSNVKLFVEVGVKTVIATTPTLDNLEHIEKTYINFAKDLLQEMNKPNLYFKLAQKLITGRNVNALLKEKARKYSKITRKLANELYPNGEIRNFINNIQIGTGLKNCGYGGLSISSDGKFFLCNRVEDLEPVATNKDDFKNVLEKANYYYNWSSVDNVIPCMNCEIKYICGGGCRIDEYHFAGLHTKISENQPLTKIDCPQEYKDSIYEKMINSIKYTYKVE